jgi:hypothetical protein
MCQCPKKLNLCMAQISQYGRPLKSVSCLLNVKHLCYCKWVGWIRQGCFPPSKNIFDYETVITIKTTQLDNQMKPFQMGATLIPCWRPLKNNQRIFSSSLNLFPKNNRNTILYDIVKLFKLMYLSNRGLLAMLGLFRSHKLSYGT